MRVTVGMILGNLAAGERRRAAEAIRISSARTSSKRSLRAWLASERESVEIRPREVRVDMNLGRIGSLSLRSTATKPSIGRLSARATDRRCHNERAARQWQAQFSQQISISERLVTLRIRAQHRAVADGQHQSGADRPFGRGSDRASGSRLGGRRGADHRTSSHESPTVSYCVAGTRFMRMLPSSLPPRSSTCRGTIKPWRLGRSSLRRFSASPMPRRRRRPRSSSACCGQRQIGAGAQGPVLCRQRPHRAARRRPLRHRPCRLGGHL